MTKCAALINLVSTLLGQDRGIIMEKNTNMEPFSFGVCELSELVKKREELETAPSNKNDSNMVIQNLPSVVISNVLSFLSCKDKLNAVAALPTWTEHLRSSMAWHWFCSNSDIEMTRQLLRQLHQMSCWCIRHYGRYFQNCVLVLQYLDLCDMGLELVEHVSNHCVCLRHFRLYHPDCFTLAEQDMFERYVNLLHSTMENCKGLKQVALCNLDYMAINKRDGVKELFDRFIEDKTHIHITELEFSHAYDYSQPVTCLAQFDNLRKLKCPIQVLTTSILCQLASKSLCDIYVLNDGSTLNEDFNEAVALQWFDIAKVLPVLRVHYIVLGRTLGPENLVSNPLVHTVILDSLCNPIGQDLITAIGLVYGDSLKVFAHLATEWNFLPYDDIKLVALMYRNLVTQCPKLDTIASALDMPSTALLLIAANQKIKHLWVDREKVQFDFGEVSHTTSILYNFIYNHFTFLLFVSHCNMCPNYIIQ